MYKSLGRISAIIQKETIQILRDWRTLVLLLGLPLIELFLFAYAVDLTVYHIPTAVADMSLDAQSRAFIDALAVSTYFDIEMYVADEARIIQAIDQGQVKAGVVIPPNLASNIERNAAQVLLILDGSDSFTVQSGYSAAVAIAQAHATDLMVEQISRMGTGLGLSLSESSEMLPITTSTRVLYNPDLDDMTFVVPGLAAMLLQTLATGQAAIGIVRERELGTLEQLLITPIRPIELVVGKMIPKITLTFIDMLVIILLGVSWFGVPFKGNPWLFAWLALLFIIAGLGLGLLISTVSKNQRQAQQLTVVLMMLSMLLTGFIYPLAPMPVGVRMVSNLIPLTYFIRIARGIITKGIGLTFMWSDVVALAVYAFIVMLSAAVTFKKRLD